VGDPVELRLTRTSATQKVRPPGPGWVRLDHYLVHCPPHRPWWEHLWGRLTEGATCA